MSTPTKRRSYLYRVDTYSAGWVLSAVSIAEARRKALAALLDHRLSGGYVVERIAKANAARYPRLDT